MSDRATATIRQRVLILSAVAILGIVVGACAGDGGTVVTGEEESGTELAVHESYDAVRNGARLVLSYDAEKESFDGFVENTTDTTLKRVRVEVHLSNGTELGPTTPTDLIPGERLSVSLSATGNNFDGWTAHPEVGESRGGEHGDGEGDDEHGEGGERGHKEGDSDWL